MASTLFVNGVTLTDDAWFNAVDTWTYSYLSSISGTDTITAAGPASLTALAAGQTFRFITAGANTGAVTLNITPSGGVALGAKAVTRDGSVALVANDLASGALVEVMYDGTRFQVARLASHALVTATQSWTKAQRGTPVALTSSGNAIAIDMSLGNNFSHTMTENTTIGAPSNMVAGQSGVILGTQHASSAKTLAFNAAWVLPSGSNGTITTTVGGKFMVLYSTFDSGTVIYDIRNLS